MRETPAVSGDWAVAFGDHFVLLNPDVAAGVLGIVKQRVTVEWNVLPHRDPTVEAAHWGVLNIGREDLARFRLWCRGDRTSTQLSIEHAARVVEFLGDACECSPTRRGKNLRARLKKAGA